MSIQSEITRITSAKSDIADAIEEKGVEVPSGSMIDDMAELILQIQSGGGGVDGDSLYYGNRDSNKVSIGQIDYCTL